MPCYTVGRLRLSGSDGSVPCAETSERRGAKGPTMAEPNKIAEIGAELAAIAAAARQPWGDQGSPLQQEAADMAWRASGLWAAGDYDAATRLLKRINTELAPPLLLEAEMDVKAEP